MEAKDTVMHLDDIDAGHMPDSYASQRKALEKQAEISFKAGWDECKRRGLNEDAWLDGREKGIKEVVEWGDELCYAHNVKHNAVDTSEGMKRRNCPKCQQAQLKEWGITDSELAQNPH